MTAHILLLFCSYFLQLFFNLFKSCTFEGLFSGFFVAHQDNSWKNEGILLNHPSQVQSFPPPFLSLM